MKSNGKFNLSKLEKIIVGIYILYVLFAMFVYDKLLLSIIILLFMILIASKRKTDGRDNKYLIKEKLELLIRHFFLLCILWNIVLGWFDGEIIFENSIIGIVIYSVLLIISVVPFAGVLKAISKLERIDANKNVDIYRELPQNIEPAIIANLMQEDLTDKSDISATLLDLVRRGYLTIENDVNNTFDNVSDGILDKKLVINKNYIDLKEYERFLIKWFSKTSENNNEINMSKLKNMLKDSGDFKANYQKLEKLIKNESNKVEFYDDSSKLSKFSKFSAKWGKRMLIISFCLLIFTILGFLLDYVGGISETFAIVLAISFFIHVVLSIISITIYDLRLPEEYLNEIGKDNIRKWNGFIKFLEEYTLIEHRKSEEVHIWQEYLVYGVAFGVAKETIDSMDKAYGFQFYPKK